MAREYFAAYHSYLKGIEVLSDAEAGRLFRACLSYSKTGEAQELSGNEKILFPSWREQIDRDKAKYDAICIKNRQNGALGGQANATERYRTPPNAPQGKGKGKEEGKGKGEKENKNSFFLSGDEKNANVEKRVENSDAAKIWQSVLGVLKTELSETAINTWFDDCCADGWDGNTLSLWSPSEFKRKTISEKFGARIAAITDGLKTRGEII